MIFLLTMYQCYIFFLCSPKLLATAAEQFKYKMPYLDYFGGIVAISWKHFQLINGLSNRYKICTTNIKLGNWTTL